MVLHAAGGPGIGVGHLSRTRALGLAIAAADPRARVRLLFEGPEQVIRRFAAAGIGLVHAADRGEALEQRAWMAREGSPCILVTDLLELDETYYLGARAEGYSVLVHINDSGSGRARANLIIDEDPIPTPPPAGFRGTLLAGNAYRMIAPALVAQRPQAPWRGARVQRVLLTLGGADPGGIGLALLDGLYRPGRRAEMPEIRLRVLVGPAFPPALVEAIEGFAREEPTVQAIAPVFDMAPLLLDNDLIVTLGGITSYEAMCLGRPVACVRHGHMGIYVQRMASEGLVQDLGDSTGAARRLTEILGAGAALGAAAERAYRSIDGRGARRVAETVLRRAAPSEGAEPQHSDT